MGGVSVTGGFGGITASADDLRELARRFGAVATDAGGSALTLHGYLTHPALVTSAVFDPVGAAAVEAELVAALDAPGGLSWVAVEAAALDGELRAAAASYLAVDDLRTEVGDAVLGAARLPIAVAAGTGTLASTGNPLRAAQAGVAADPEAADAVVDALGIPSLLVTAARVVPDGHGVAVRHSIDTERSAATPPRRLSDVVAELGRRDEDPRHGAIDVRILETPGDRRRVIVDITGTKSWDPLPTRDVTSLTTNTRALVGARTAYEQGVLAAMRRAGVRHEDEVMLVGHSQGGMVAITTARDASASGEFRVTHVITAGSPVGRTVGDLPARVQVLALENSRDVVPHLDGAANPDRRNVTTVTGTAGDRTIVGDHSVDTSYVHIARDTERTKAESVRTFLRSADGYFGAHRVTTHTFQIQRRS